MEFCKICKDHKFVSVITLGSCECTYRLNCCNMNLILTTLHSNKKCSVCKKEYNEYQLKKIENYLKIVHFSLETSDYEILFHNMNDYYQELIKESLDYIHKYYSMTITDLNTLSIVNIIKIYLEEDFVDYFLEKYNFVQSKHYENI